MSVLRMEQADTAEVSVLLTDDHTIRELNLLYRGKDTPTDVLSFCQRESVGDVPEPPDIGSSYELLGDVVISVDTARRQAEERGASLDDELCELAAHGTLHLLGYDDATPEEAAVMLSKASTALCASTVPSHDHEK